MKLFKMFKHHKPEVDEKRDPDAISYRGLMPVYGVPNYKWHRVIGDKDERMSHRDRFLLTVVSLAKDNTIQGRHDTTAWPDFDGNDNTSDGILGFTYAAFRVPADVIPDDIYQAVKAFFEYWLVRSLRYHSDDERKEKRPSWLPTDWEF